MICDSNRNELIKLALGKMDSRKSYPLLHGTCCKRIAHTENSRADVEGLDGTAYLNYASIDLDVECGRRLDGLSE